ncbi:peroxide stress protein YaaA [Corynebacterium kalidii]|uniref:Peroxide stress protein YaaA n=1 Tax=Corynebacterium kalidii TaxID=2931982 RepID=A0A9X1WJT2_9CORY|nr:peroxide stress protein YaaA [Corynebacterium kalidii]MCJ7859508.1 peroxide stress protein YaaA [Corynebacterium kalidii]
MFILLPPSETKASGGTGPALDIEGLSFPELTGIRRRNIRDLSALDPDDALQVLGISEKLRGEAEANTRLLEAPTTPAILRYTGVLYDALDVSTLAPSARARLGVGSALFGLLSADDPVPHYRLSAGTKLPWADGAAGATGSAARVPTMKARWGSAVTDALTRVPGTVVDLRSGGYQQLGRVPGAVTVRVESVREDGSRKVVSHFNKHYKGLLARELASADTDLPTPGDVAGVAAIARRAGLTVEVNDTVAKDDLTLVV